MSENCNSSVIVVGCGQNNIMCYLPVDPPEPPTAKPYNPNMPGLAYPVGGAMPMYGWNVQKQVWE